MKTYKKIPRKPGVYWYRSGRPKARARSCVVKEGSKGWIIMFADRSYLEVLIPGATLDGPFKVKQYFIIEVSGGVEMTLHGPYLNEEAWERAAQKIRDAQDPGQDSIFALALDKGVLEEESAPGQDRTFEPV